MKNFLKTAVLVILLSSPALAEQEANDKYTTPIVEKSVTVKSISYEELRAIFTLSVTRWSDGSKIVVVTLPDDNTIQRKFLWEYFGLSASRYAEIVANKTQPGMTNKKPITVNSEIEALQQISHTKGAIGFLGKNFKINKNENVKQIHTR